MDFGFGKNITRIAFEYINLMLKMQSNKLKFYQVKSVNNKT